ncbi:helix-turn-helix domain-containing protein [Litchfieldia salsa]|uniref:Tetratricopeptide repeat-containing protein n=1 Tax=Litchfieldia salsa TaxID=930152 RepID=A0A1H0QBA8_9BACI|nr:helix-turn-helix domain-containing protein [Litchfieldia salsa]SDP14651.1 Tetratricopeptide repeat-containing protein [Litchfieldia salsa]
MNIGNRIKLERIQQNMTQAQLSKGIISISYLSKIENGQTNASREVLEMLCERLGLPLTEEQETELIKELKVWYFKIARKNVSESTALYSKYKSIFEEKNDTIAMIYFRLFEIRYLFLINDMEQAKVQIQKIEQVQDLFDRDMNYYFYKFSGLYCYLTGQYPIAKQQYQLTEKLLINSNLYQKWEEADLYYSMGLTFSQLNNPTLSIRYVEKALQIYQSDYDLKRCAECHILLGIGYVKTKEFNLAEESYRTASKLAYQMNDTYLKGLIHHNLGHLLSLENRAIEAISEFENSLQHKEKENSLGRLKTIHSLTYEYFQIGQIEKCRFWIGEGLSILSRNINSQTLGYHIHFTLYDYLINNQFDQYEQFFKKEGLSYFKEYEMSNYISYYSDVLAKHYESAFKYKQACYYYSIATDALKKQNIIY